MPSLDYRGDAQVELLGTFKRRYGNEYDKLPTKAENAPAGGFFLGNGMFGSVDAEILYCMIRHVKPKRIVEVGSGWTTLLAVQALNKNGQEGSPGEMVSIDPVAPGFVYDQGATIIKKPLQDIPEALDALEPGDILLTDTSHIFVANHEIDYVLRKMENLEGVYVHFHDIFLPNAYPEEWESRKYDEQLHLVDFLFNHPGWEVVVGSAWLHQYESAFLAGTFKTYDQDRPIPPGSFWLMKPSRVEEIQRVADAALEGSGITAKVEQAPVPTRPHEFQSDRGGKKCLVCGKTMRAKVHA